MSKKTLVNISSNIITSESLLEKLDSLDEGNNFSLAKLKSGKFRKQIQDNVMTKYLEASVKLQHKVKFSRQVIHKPLEPKKITTIYPNLDFFSVEDKELLLLRASMNRTEPLSGKTLLETINDMLHPSDKQLDFIEVSDKLVERYKYNMDDIRGFINGDIHDPQYIKSSVSLKGEEESFEKLGQDSYIKAHKFFSRIVNIISELIDVNLLFILPSLVSVDVETSKSLIISSIIESRKTIGLVISIPALHPISMYKKTAIPLSTIFFDNILQLDYKNNVISEFIGNEITKKIIIEIGLNTSDYLFVNQITDNDEITFEPLDRRQPLKIVEIQGPDTKKRTYLLGIYGNLYEDDDQYNDLVGKLDSWDISNNGKAKVFWCKNYFDRVK